MSEKLEIIEECKFYNEADSCNECSISEFGFCSWKEKIENPTLPNVPTCHYEQLQLEKAENYRQSNLVLDYEQQLNIAKKALEYYHCDCLNDVAGQALAKIKGLNNENNPSDTNL